MTTLDFRFDSRLVPRHLSKGLVTEAEVEQHLAALPDVEAKGEPLRIADDADADADGKG